MTTHPKTLSQILSESFALTQSLLMPLLAGAVVFGIITAIVGAGMIGRGVASPELARFQQQMDDFSQKMDDIKSRVDAGDAAAINDLAQMKDLQVPTVPNPFMSAFVPAMVAGVVLLILIGIIARAYMTVVLVKNIADPMQAFSMFGSKIIPLTLLWLWMGLRSFVWIPVLGWIAAIYLGPRFTAAPIYLLEEGKGVTESVRLSMRVTLGAWFRIFVPCFVAGLIAVVASGLLNALFGWLGLVGAVVLAVIAQLISAWVMATALVVARDVMAHPTAKVIAA